MHALPSRREALHLVRARPDIAERAARLARETRQGVADRHHALEVLGQVVEEVCVGPKEVQPHRVLVELLHAARVDGAQPAVAEESEALGEGAAERVHHVVRGHGLPVVELDPLAESDHPAVGLLRDDLLGQAVHDDVVLLVEAREALPAGDEPRDVRLGHDVLAVDEVRRPPARDAQAEGAAALDQRLGERRFGQRPEGASGDDDPEGRRPPKKVLSRHSALNLAAQRFVGRSHGRPPGAVVSDLREAIPAQFNSCSWRKTSARRQRSASADGTGIRSTSSRTTADGPRCSSAHARSSRSRPLSERRTGIS